MSLIDTRRGTRGPSITVPDNPWGTIYDPTAVRHAVEVLTVEGLDDRTAWARYLHAGLDEHEAEAILQITRAVYGLPAMKIRRNRSK